MIVFPTTGRRRLVIFAAAGGIVLIGLFSVNHMLAQNGEHAKAQSEPGAKSGRYMPTATELANLTIEPVTERTFRVEHVTEGKIAVNEESSTPIFSPYAGRIAKLLVKPSDLVERGQPLFVVEAIDTVQSLSDFTSALGALNTSRSKLNLAQIVEKRANDLYAGRAVPLKDWQQAQADLTAARNDVRSAETALEAAHNRLLILGRSEEQIAEFQETRQISAETPIYSPISGTVVQRKVGPGQYVSAGASDPVFVIGDLSTVWLSAFVREGDAADVAIGQDVTFSVVALPGRVYNTQLNYLSAVMDPSTRRLVVRASIDNKDKLLKPEMFANATIYASANKQSVGVPMKALIVEGTRTRVWVSHDDNSVELRDIETGLVNGDAVEVVKNLAAGEKIVTRGSLFIDRAATSGS